MKKKINLHSIVFGRIGLTVRPTGSQPIIKLFIKCVKGAIVFRNTLLKRDTNKLSYPGTDFLNGNVTNKTSACDVPGTTILFTLLSVCDNRLALECMHFARERNNQYIYLHANVVANNCSLIMESIFLI